MVYRVSRPAGELVVLRGADARAAAAATPMPSAARPQPLTASPGHARISLPAGDVDRLLVLAEPYSRRWHATLAGHALVPMRAYGWAQAWALPTDGGAVRVGRDDGHRPTLLVVEAVLVGIALLLSLPSRGRQS